ncbi:MAG: hypothetical protein IT530_11275 [Burkholderiales bacterium]|nr:hypothetical protein [Burkholderiales bacterium]
MVKPEKRTREESPYASDLGGGSTVVQVKADSHSFRNVRAALLELAYYLADHPDRRGLLLLSNPRITDTALKEEWQLVEHTLRGEVTKRLSVVATRVDGVAVIAGSLEADLRERIRGMVANNPPTRRIATWSARDAIFSVLLLHWLRRSGPLTTQYLMRAVGCSYPTVAAELKRLGSHVKRSSDRRIQLWSFPVDEWQRLVAGRERAHPMIHYVDRSGQRRTPQALLNRASELGLKNLAVGGIIASRYYYPEIDLRGTPRLDLTLHCPPKEKVDLSFVERIDPALERAEGRDEPAALAVHILGTKTAFFTAAVEGLPLADEVDCLLSLHDARLEAQAKEFLNYLVTRVG